MLNGCPWSIWLKTSLVSTIEDGELMSNYLLGSRCGRGSGSNLFNKTRIMVWRIIQHGFFTGSRALKFTMSNGIYPRCKGKVENVDHLFFSCNHSKSRWAEIASNLRGTNLGVLVVFMGMLSLFLYLSRWWLPFGMVATFWDERNKAQFQGKWIYTPLKVILQNALFNGQTFLEKVRNKKKVT